MRKLFLILLLCFFSISRIIAQYSVYGEVYNPLHELRDDATIYLFRNNETLPIDSTNLNPFTFEVKDTTSLYFVEARIRSVRDINLLLNFEFCRNHMLGVSNSNFLGLELYGDYDDNGSLNSLDLLRLNRKLLPPCDIGQLNMYKDKLIRIDKRDLQLNRQDSRQLAMKINAEGIIRDRYKILNFENNRSENNFILGISGLPFERPEKYITPDPNLISKVYLPDAVLIKGQKYSSKVIIESNALLKSFVLYNKLNNIDTISFKVDNHSMDVLEIDNVLFMSSLSERTGKSKFEFTFEIVANKDCTTREVFDTYLCEVFNNQALYIVNNKYYSSDKIETIFITDFDLLKCNNYWPPDTTLGVCSDLATYQPFSFVCRQEFTYTFTDRIFYDTNGICSKVERKWFRKSPNEGTSTQHTQIITFLTQYNQFCNEEIVLHLEMSNNLISISDVINNPSASNYSFNHSANLDNLNLANLFDKTVPIISYDLQNGSYCKTYVQLITCELLSKLAHYSELTKQLDKGGIFVLEAEEFDQGSYNNCDPIVSITMAKSYSQVYFKSFPINYDIINSYNPIKLKYTLASGKSHIAEVRLQLTESPVKSLVLETYDDEIRGGEVYKAVFSSNNFSDIAGLQCQIHLNNSKYIGVSNVGFPVNEFATNFVYASNNFRMLWVMKILRQQDFSGLDLFSIDIVPTRNCKVSDVFNVSYEDFESFAVSNSLLQVPIDLKFVFKQRSTPIKELTPNNNKITVHSPNNGQNLTFEPPLEEAFDAFIYNVQGQLSQSLKHSSSNTSSTLDLTQCLNNGVYFLQIVGEKGNEYYSKFIVGQ